MLTIRLRIALAAALIFFSALSVTLAQKPFKEYPAIEYNNFPLPDGWDRKAEFTRARLRYPDIYGYPFRTLYYQGGEFPGYWTMDYPRSDRHLLTGLSRLTRIDVRSSEQVVTLNDGSDDVFHWPALYAVEVGHMQLRDVDALQLREYLDRGGFLMVDDFHGDEVNNRSEVAEWTIFRSNMQRVFPDRQIEDIPDGDDIFHTVYNLQDRFQVPGAQYFESGITYEKGETGKVPHWRAIRDEKGRIEVAICHNMDLGDAWEVSDEARYPEKWASLAYRIAVNYFVYDMTR